MRLHPVVCEHVRGSTAAICTGWGIGDPVWSLDVWVQVPLSRGYEHTCVCVTGLGVRAYLCGWARAWKLLGEERKPGSVNHPRLSLGDLNPCQCLSH